MRKTRGTYPTQLLIGGVEVRANNRLTVDQLKAVLMSRRNFTVSIQLQLIKDGFFDCDKAEGLSIINRYITQNGLKNDSLTSAFFNRTYEYLVIGEWAYMETCMKSIAL